MTRRYLSFWFPTSGVAQCESYDVDVVEWSDDRDELGDEIDRREHPQQGEPDDKLRASRNSWIPSEDPSGGRACRENDGEVAGRSGREGSCEQQEYGPRCGQDSETNQDEAEHSINP